MSPHALELLELGLQRFAFSFTSATVLGAVPPGRAGVYLLLEGGFPVYIGRSDTCVRTRLASHPMLGRATHFSWQPCRNPTHAYHMEAFWYHALRERGVSIRNRTHPARPGGWRGTCPFCRSTELDALRLALPHTAAGASRGGPDHN